MSLLFSSDYGTQKTAQERALKKRQYIGDPATEGKFKGKGTLTRKKCVKLRYRDALGGLKYEAAGKNNKMYVIMFLDDIMSIKWTKISAHIS
jgi:hypothetical protein